jgi:hypothetical protein
MAIGSHLKLNAQQVNYLNRVYKDRVMSYDREGYVGMPVSHVSDEVIEDLCEAALEDEMAESIVALSNEHFRLVKNFQDNLEATRNGPHRYGSLSK